MSSKCVCVCVCNNMSSKCVCVCVCVHIGCQERFQGRNGQWRRMGGWRVGRSGGGSLWKKVLSQAGQQHYQRVYIFLLIWGHFWKKRYLGALRKKRTKMIAGPKPSLGLDTHAATKCLGNWGKHKNKGDLRFDYLKGLMCFSRHLSS